MSNTVAFYHTDLDGHLSGAIIEKHLRRKDPLMVPINYGDNFPWHLIDEETEVWMADFSLQPWVEMAKLQNSCKKLVWIDHHKTAIQAHDEWVEETDGEPIDGVREDGKAACWLCWDYCNPGTALPRAVFLAAKFDVWAWHDIPGAIQYHYGTQLYETDPATKKGVTFWNLQLNPQCSDPGVEAVEKQGTLLMKYIEKSDAAYIKSNSFETTLDGLNFIATNRKGGSRQFKSVWDPEKYHAMLTFAWMGDGWSVSMYTEREDVDVGEVAKNHGGGGHRGAAGFSCEELPFALR